MRVGDALPHPSVCVGLSGALDRDQSSCRAQSSPAAPELAGSASFGSGAQLRENPFAVGEAGGRKGKDVPSYRLFCKPLQGNEVGVENCPSCTLTQGAADEGEGCWGGVLSHHQARSFH